MTDVVVHQYLQPMKAIQEIRSAINDMAGRVADLEVDGDYQTLAAGIQQVQQLKRELSVLERDAQLAAARLLPDHRKIVIDGIGLCELATESKTVWDARAALVDVIRDYCVNVETGEVVANVAAIVQAVIEVLPTAVALRTGRPGQSGGLWSSGLDPDNYRERTYGDRKMTVPKP